MAKLRANLLRFQRIPPGRREAECADEGEQTCRALLAELDGTVPLINPILTMG